MQANIEDKKNNNVCKNINESSTLEHASEAMYESLVGVDSVNI